MIHFSNNIIMMKKKKLCVSDSQCGFGLDVGFIDHLRIVNMMVSRDYTLQI
jgi:hypothetical protein